MNLKDIRTQFIKLSGRYDLVVDSINYNDDGADFYINAGIQMLDRMVEVPSSRATLYFKISTGDYSLTFNSGCRLVNSIWINDDSIRGKLEKLTLEEFKLYYNSSVDIISQGYPLHYALVNLRTLESTDRDDLGEFLDKTLDEDDTDYNYRGVVLGPPADQDYVVGVSGIFKSGVLSNDNDSNFWTLEEFDLVIRSALYKLETFGRGTETSKKWLEDIQRDVFEIDKDQVQEESVDIHQTRG